LYRNCIFCSADLGANSAIESFPVGRAVAFDSVRGRLWAVCRSCGRWNLAPIEERWEPVETAERQFRDAPTRVHSENVGLARMADGTRLIRIGDALRGEFAAWRYGRQLLRRRVRYWVGGAVAGGGAIAVYSGLSAVGVLGGSSMLLFGIGHAWDALRNRTVVHRLAPDPASGGRATPIRRWHVSGMNLQASRDGGVELVVRDLHSRGWITGRQVAKESTDVTVLYDSLARSVLTRAMVHVNETGASTRRLRAATSLFDDQASPDALLHGCAARGVALGIRAGRYPRGFPGAEALALEMALNEEDERRAMEGELAALEAAWREAEEIAAIADRLPFDIARSGVRRAIG
jgi:hypothetical protein